MSTTPALFWGIVTCSRTAFFQNYEPGGDLLKLHGPTISCHASQFHEVVNYPVFIETSDGAFYKAESVGNNPEGLTRFRYRCKNALNKVRRQVFSFKNFIRERILRGRQ
jgi:hypothetical protein